MKLRYYLRGLGIGILVTVAILSLTGGGEATLTDAQIRERALELGMVDSDSLVLSEIRKEDPKDESQESTEDGETKPAANTETQEPENTETEPAEESTEKSVENSTEESTQMSAEKTTEQSTAPSIEQPSEEGSLQTIPEDLEEDTRPSIEKDSGAVSFEIRSGAGSYSVSRELEEVGLVADAESFDNYLCNSGYSKAIRVGTYEIVPGTDEEEIAKIITGKR